MTVLPHQTTPTIDAGPTDADFLIGPDGFSQEQRLAALDKLKAYLVRQGARAIGYQASQDLTDSEDLGMFLSHHINNVGDPFVDSHFTLNSRWPERAVLDYYARLWNARIPAQRHRTHGEDFWGYVLSMGSTEGNLYAMWNARDYLDGRALVRDKLTIGRGVAARSTYTRAAAPEDNPNAYTPVTFFSEDTHYSHIKAMRALDLATFYDMGADLYPGQCPLDTGPWSTHPTVEGWPVGVPSTGGEAGPGTVDIDALACLVEFFAAKGHPILVTFNVGSTFKGACDDVEAACARLRPIFAKHGLANRRVHYDPEDRSKYDVRRGYWVHVDGALGGAYLPYVEQAVKQGLLDTKPPVFDFRVPEVASIVTSGHKYPGAPFPTGVYMSKAGNRLQPPDDPAVIASPDTTFAGSRNGLASIVMWNHLARHSEADHLATVVRVTELADYAAGRLRDLSAELAGRGEPGAEDGLHVGHTEMSLSVWFRQPTKDIVFKYSLACVPLDVGGVEHDYSHLYVMPHVTKEMIDDLIDDLGRPGVFDRRSPE